MKGEFSLRVTVNDVLVISGYQYKNDTLLITDLKIKEIFLDPETTMLQQVDIYNQEVNLGTMYDPQFHNQTVVYQRDAAGNYKGGVAFRIWSSKGEEHKRARLMKLQHDEEVKLQIAKAFSAKNLAQYLPLNPDEMDGFIIRYIPSVSVYTANNFNLLNYINSCYKAFLKLTPQQRKADKLSPPF